MLQVDLRRLLDEKRVPYKLHPHEPLLTVKEIEGRLPFPPESWVKSLAFQVRGEGWALVAAEYRWPRTLWSPTPRRQPSNILKEASR